MDFFRQDEPFYTVEKPSMSKKFHFRKNVGVHSKIDIDVGKYIMPQHPLTMQPLPSLWENICHYCFSENENLSKCSSCLNARYCSQECQKKHWHAIHKIVCKKGLFAVDENDIETFLIISLSLQKFQNNLLLSSRKSHIPLKILEKLLLIGFDEEKLDDAKKNYSCFSSNNFTIHHDAEPRGVGVYLSASLINHSCRPNLTPVFLFQKGKSPMLLFQVISKIKRGDELFHSYVDLGKIPSIRKSILLNQYNFSCKCERCQSPPKIDSQMTLLKISSFDTEKYKKILSSTNLNFHGEQECYYRLQKLLKIFEKNLHKNHYLLRDLFKLLFYFSSRIYSPTSKISEKYKQRLYEIEVLYYENLNFPHLKNMKN